MSASREKKTRQEKDPSILDPKTAREAAERKKQKRSDRMYAAIFIAFLLVAAIVVTWNSGILQKRATAMTINGEKYTAAEVNYYYSSVYNQFLSSYGSYASMFGLDTSKSLKTQDCAMLEDGGTWFDYFLQQAEDQMVTATALYDAAQEEGFTVDDLDQQIQDNLDSLDESVESLNSSNGTNYDRADYLQMMYGKYMTEDIYKELLTQSLVASYYAQAYQDETEASYTDQQISDAYEEDPNSYDLVDYEQILVSGVAETTTDEDGNTVEPTDEENEAAMAESKTIADELYAKYQAGEGLEALADTEDKASYSDNEGTTYSGDDLTTWLFDEARQDGDSTVIEVDGTGTYILVFHGRYRNDYDVANVRHILIQPESTELSEDDEGYEADVQAKKDAAKAEAEDILAQWKAGAATEDSFIELVKEYSQDTGSVEDGGLIPDISQDSSLVTEFKDWSLDPSRKVGDTGIVESSYGYHIMYLSSFGDPYWMVQVRSNLLTQAVNDWHAEKTEGYEATEGFGIRFVG